MSAQCMSRSSLKRQELPIQIQEGQGFIGLGGF